MTIAFDEAVTLKLSALTTDHHRPARLRAITFLSILNQGDSDFEWVVVSNLGLSTASGNLIVYLDDDNAIVSQ